MFTDMRVGHSDLILVRYMGIPYVILVYMYHGGKWYTGISNPYDISTLYGYTYWVPFMG